MNLQEQDRLARQQIQVRLQESQAILAELGRGGLRPEHAVSLDFRFVAPDEARARALRAHLEANHCRDLAIAPIVGEAAGRQRVSGRSHPTKLTAAIVGQWVPWMVVQGVKNGCEFEGWSAQVPK